MANHIIKNETKITPTLMSIIFLAGLIIAILSILGIKLGLITFLGWVIVLASVIYFLIRLFGV